MILVVGATGMLGGAVTRALLQRGKDVRILARSRSSYGALAEAGAQVVIGDLKDRASLDKACEGVDAVITTATSSQRGGEDNAQTVDLQGNRNLIDAAKAAGVRQFIFVSAGVADPNSPSPLFRAKGLTEEYLRASGLQHTVLAPNLYMEMGVAWLVGIPAAMGQPVTLVGEGNRKHSFVSQSDVVAFILACLDNPNNPAALNRKVFLGGPEPLSFRDAVAIYSRVLGRPIPVRNVAPGEPVPGLPPEATPIFAALDTYDSPMDMIETAGAFGVRLTSLEELVRRNMAHVVREAQAGVEQ